MSYTIPTTKSFKDIMTTSAWFKSDDIPVATIKKNSDEMVKGDIYIANGQFSAPAFGIYRHVPIYSAMRITHISMRGDKKIFTIKPCRLNGDFVPRGRAQSGMMTAKEMIVIKKSEEGNIRYKIMGSKDGKLIAPTLHQCDKNTLNQIINTRQNKNLDSMLGEAINKLLTSDEDKHAILELSRMTAN
jgi:hypothetical protein